MEELKQNPAAAIVLAVAVCAVVLLMAFMAERNGRRKREAAADLAAREMAVIVEHVKISSGGAICALFLVVTVVGSFFAYAAAKTVFQQIEAGVSLIAGCILFGLGVALGRTRTYRVYRSEQRVP